MRIRRKKHLEERLKNVSEYLIVPNMDIPNVKLAIENKKPFNFNQIFNNDNPVELEIGCGKGGFIVEKAQLYPNINFLAVELLENIIVMAAELAKEKGLTNVKFVNSGAEYLPRYIPDNSISNIYLNFSPPFPKDGYEHRRLTCDRFISTYKKFLLTGGCVYQKTDDRPFFDYSFSKFNEHGFEVMEVTQLISQQKIENIQTEYEKKFIQLGIKANALIAKKV